MKNPQLFDFVPKGWFTDWSRSAIWVTGIRIFGVTPHDFAQGPKTIPLRECIAILLFGQLNYLDSHVEVKVLPNNQVVLDSTEVQQKKTPIGGWLLVVQPFKIDGIGVPEDLINFRLSTTMGMLAAFNGRNMVFQRYFEYSVELRDRKQSARSPTLINPLSFPAPRVDQERLTDIELASRRLGEKGQEDRHQIDLSLHWFELALKDDSFDSFLKYWIALEVIGMPDTTNIRPLVEAMARAYLIEYQEAVHRFQLGRLFGLRSDMVHQGKRIPMNQYLNDYIEAVYVDILFERLAIPSERRAEKVMAMSEWTIEKALGKL